MAIALRITLVQALDSVLHLATHQLKPRRILAALSVAHSGPAHSASCEKRPPVALFVSPTIALGLWCVSSPSKTGSEG